MTQKTSYQLCIKKSFILSPLKPPEKMSVTDERENFGIIHIRDFYHKIG